MKLNILGTEYTFRKVRREQDEYFRSSSDCGYCEFSTKKIVILDMRSVDSWKDAPEEAVASEERETARHEILHAFLGESGLRFNSFPLDRTPWARNEEMVDWFAIQYPKIKKAFEKAGCA